MTEANIEKQNMARDDFLKVIAGQNITSLPSICAFGEIVEASTFEGTIPTSMQKAIEDSLKPFHHAWYHEKKHELSCR